MFPKISSFFSKYIKEIRRMDLVFVDKLEKQNKEVKFLLVAVDVFSRFFRVKQWKQNMPKKLCMLSKQGFLKKARLKNFEVIKEQGMGDLSKKFSMEKDIKLYSATR